MQAKFCPNCGSPMEFRDGKSSWTRTGICTNAECRTMAYTVFGDMAPSTTSYSVLSNAEYIKLVNLFEQLGKDGTIKDC